MVITYIVLLVLCRSVVRYKSVGCGCYVYVYALDNRVV